MPFFSRERFRRGSLWIAIGVVLLGCIPGGPARLALWFESKSLDLFFLVLPFPPPEHPVVIAARDQTLIELAGEDSGREATARALRKLASAGAKAVGIDFIYDQARDASEDADLGAAFRATPGTVVAERFKPRSAVGAGGIETISISDERATRPPPPLSLYEPLVGEAANRGLVNILPDGDRVVRSLPLAFHPDGEGEFRPTLGFATWIHGLLASIPEGSWASAATRALGIRGLPGGKLRPDDPAFVASASEVLRGMFADAPYRFTGLNHEGLNGILRRSELIAAALQVVRGCDPEVRRAWLDVARGLDLGSLPARTRLTLPFSALPWFGDFDRPLLRIPFTRYSGPMKGDGIPVISLGTLAFGKTPGGSARIEVGEEKTPSPASDPGFARSLAFSFSPVGTGTLCGQVFEFDGTPASGVDAICRSGDSPFWGHSLSDGSGSYRFVSLPPGTFSIELRRFVGNTLQRLELLDGAVVGDSSPSSGTVPVAFLLPQTISLEGTVPPVPEMRSLVLEADGVFTSRVASDGCLPLRNLPAGFQFNLLDVSDQEAGSAPTGISIASSSTRAISEACGIPLAGRRVALTEAAAPWKRVFRASVDLPPGNSSFVISGLGPALGASILGVREGCLETRASPAETDLLVGEECRLATFPADVRGAVGTTVFSGRVENVGTGCEVLLLPSSGALVRTTLNEGALSVRLPVGECELLADDGARRGRIDPIRTIVQGRAIFLGTTLIEDQDFVSTPVNFLDGEFRQMPGVNLHAHLVSTLDRAQFLYPLPVHPDAAPRTWPLRLLLILAPLFLVLDHLFTTWGALRAGAAVFGLAGVWIIFAGLLFKAGYLLPFAIPILSLATFGGARGYGAYVDSRDLEKRTRFTFGRFVSAAMVDQILRDPDSVKPGGEKRELSIIFTDLAGFTSISEALSPEELVALMNEYLGEMTAILFQHGGTLDKYIGDALMGFWNFPTEKSGHALDACRCAIAMQRRLAVLRERWKDRGLPVVAMRAGINTADCIVGFIGSDMQMNFTCMGDGVNLASRLEGANKAYGTLMMIAESTRNAIEGKGIRTRFLDFLAVKGKEKPIRTFELIGEEGTDDEIWKKVLPAYEAGIRKYLARSWDCSIVDFQRVLEVRPDDGPAKTYIDRCRAFQADPPDEKWDGSFHLKTK